MGAKNKLFGGKEKVEEVKPVNGKENPRNNLIEQRRALGLCFKCGEKYYPGHQCKGKVNMLQSKEEDLQQEVEEQ